MFRSSRSQLRHTDTDKPVVLCVIAFPGFEPSQGPDVARVSCAGEVAFQCEISRSTFRHRRLEIGSGCHLVIRPLPGMLR